MTRPLVLCLGNDILSDDGFGPAVAKALQQQEAFVERADVVFAPVAGFRLLELLQGRNAVLIIDSIQAGGVPVGHVQVHDCATPAAGRHLMGSHQIGLPTALEFGRRLQIQLPERVAVLTVEVADPLTVSEDMTPEVAAAVPAACRLASSWLEGVIDAAKTIAAR